MKRPDDIKKGMAGCNARRCAKDCPYGDTIPCVMMMHKDACEYIQQLEAQAPKWISVEERLPETKLAVLGYGLRSAKYNEYDPFPAVHVVYTRGEDEGWFTFWNNEYVSVTHWMPLPEPPKEDNHAN